MPNRGAKKVQMIFGLIQVYWIELYIGSWTFLCDCSGKIELSKVTICSLLLDFCFLGSTCLVILKFDHLYKETVSRIYLFLEHFFLQNHIENLMKNLRLKGLILYNYVGVLNHFTIHLLLELSTPAFAATL